MATSLRMFQSIWKSVTTSKGFDRVLSAVNLREVSRGSFTCDLDVGEEHLSSWGNLSHSFVATLFDAVTASTVASLNQGRFGSTVQLNSSFFGSAAIGDRLHISAEMCNADKTLVLTKARICHGNGDVIARCHQLTFVKTAAPYVLIENPCIE